jgi:hypothetical protein
MGFFDKKVGDMTIIEFVLYLFLINLIVVLIGMGLQKLLK